MRLNRSLTGHRFLFDSVQVGGSRLQLPAQACERARGQLRELQGDAARTWREVSFSPSVQARLDGVGVLTHEEATELGAVGPVARASGSKLDARSASPALWYPSSFSAARPSNPSGEGAARLELRAVELEETFAMLDELLSEPIEEDAAIPGGPSSPLGVARVESPRGETVCVVSTDPHRIRRLRLRTASYATSR
jgi:Ni,Fe-hydrogenase III large subunit